jgi:transposase InsO family protein
VNKKSSAKLYKQFVLDFLFTRKTKRREKMNYSINDLSNSEVNKLQGEYLSSSLNQVWTVDITSIKCKYYFFFIMDLASRRIVYYDVSQHDYTSAEAIHVFEKALTLESMVQPPRPVKYVHTDSAGIFVSKEWVEFLAVNEICPSSADSKRNQNQVSERFNRSFKKILRDRLNVMLNKGNNKTSTFQLIGEATKYNFENLKEITKELIVYYNSEKPHDHLNDLPPDTWASQARSLPDQTHIFKEKVLSEKDSNVIVDVSEDEIPKSLSRLKKDSQEIFFYEELKEKAGKEIKKNMLALSKCEIIPFVPLSKNDNSEEARLIRKYKNNVGNLELIKYVKEKRIDLSRLDSVTQKMYQEVAKDTEHWKETDIRYLETILLQNQILLSNIEELKEEFKEQTNELKLQNEELKEEFKEKTNELKLQNEELLDMNHYLVETAQKAEETQRLVLERKQKRQAAKKLKKRIIKQVRFN